MTRLRQITAAPELISNVKDSVKLDRMMDIIEENIQNGKKTIVFSIWKQVIEVAEVRLHKKHIKTAKVTEGIKDKMREIDKFRNDDDCLIILGTIASLGTGYSLPEASTIIFLDSPYTDSDRQQAIDRAHRMTTKHNISIINLVCADTVDERIEDIVQKKVEMSDIIINDTPSKKMIDYILS